MANIQFSVLVRNGALAGIESVIGTSPRMRFYTGARPANCAAAATGTLLVEMTLPVDWLETPAAGSVLKKGTWSGTAVAAGTVGYYRIYDSLGGDAHEQGDVTQAITLTTSAATAAAGNTLTFASTTGVAVGNGVAGVGVSAGATVLALTSTQAGISVASVAGVASGAQITFGDTSGNLYLSNNTLTVSQTVTIDYKQITCPGD